MKLKDLKIGETIKAEDINTEETEVDAAQKCMADLQSAEAQMTTIGQLLHETLSKQSILVANEEFEQVLASIKGRVREVLEMLEDIRER